MIDEFDNDEDVLISKTSFEYFNQLIEYIDHRGLRDDFIKWVENIWGEQK